jgi:hypothetical protein
VIRVLAGLGLLVAAGCDNVGLVGIGGGPSVPVAPGDTPFVLVRCVNASSQFTVEFLIEVDTPLAEQGAPTGGELTVSPGGNSGQVFQCPVDRITLGSFTDEGAVGYRTSFPGGPQIDLVWDQDPLVSGFSYNCGDTVVFMAVDNTNMPGGVEIVAGLIGGADQTGPFSGPDTYENLLQLLASENLLFEAP